MDLAAALEGAEIAPAARDLEVLRVASDSRRVAAGDLFVAIRGAKSDGLAHVEDAVRRGAVAVVSDRPALAGVAVPWIGVASPRRALALAAARLNGNPAEKLVLAAVTGTNGKTSTTTLLEAILARRYGAAGFLGTVGYRTARRSHRGGPHDAGGAADPGAAGRDGGRRHARRGDGSVLPLALARSRRGLPFRRRRVHESDAGPPRFSRRHGVVLPGQEAPLRAAQARGVRRDQRRRSLRGASARGGRAAHRELLAVGRGGGVSRREWPLRSVRRRVRPGVSGRAPADRLAAARALPALQPRRGRGGGALPRHPAGGRRRRDRAGRQRSGAPRARRTRASRTPSSSTTRTRPTRSSGCCRPCAS